MGFALREIQNVCFVIPLPLAHVNCEVPLQLVLYSLEMMSFEEATAATAIRFPEPDSQARATWRSFGVSMEMVIWGYDPQALPSHIHAFASSKVSSHPIIPKMSLPFFGARSSWVY